MAVLDEGVLPSDPANTLYQGSPSPGSSPVLAREDHQHVMDGDPLVQGLTAHDADASATNPVLIGGYAFTTAPSAVSTDGDAVRAWFDHAGRLAIHDGGGSLTVDNAGTFAVQAAG